MLLMKSSDGEIIHGDHGKTTCGQGSVGLLRSASRLQGVLRVQLWNL